MLSLLGNLVRLVVGIFSYFHDRAQQEIGEEKQDVVDSKVTIERQNAELQAAVNRPSDTALHDELRNGNF